MPFLLYDMTAPTDRSISATPSTNWYTSDYYNYICPRDNSNFNLNNVKGINSQARNPMEWRAGRLVR